MGGAARAGTAHLRLVVVADADQVYTAAAIELAARQEDHVDAALPGAIEQLAAAVGEEVVLAALQQRHIRPAAAARAAQERGGRRNRRRIADRDVARVADQPADHVGEQLFVAEGSHDSPPLAAGPALPPPRAGEGGEGEAPRSSQAAPPLPLSPPDRGEG